MLTCLIIRQPVNYLESVGFWCDTISTKLDSIAILSHSCIVYFNNPADIHLNNSVRHSSEDTHQYSHYHAEESVTRFVSLDGIA